MKLTLQAAAFGGRIDDSNCALPLGPITRNHRIRARTRGHGYIRSAYRSKNFRVLYGRHPARVSLNARGESSGTFQNWLIFRLRKNNDIS